MRHYPATTRGARHVQGNYKGCKAYEYLQGCETDIRYLQGVQSIYTSSTMGARCVQVIYDGCEVSIRQLQEVQGMYKAATRVVR